MTLRNDVRGGGNGNAERRTGAPSALAGLVWRCFCTAGLGSRFRMRRRSSKQVNKTVSDDAGPLALPHSGGPDAPTPAAAAPTFAGGGGIASILLRDWKRIVLITLAVTVIAWSLSSLQPPRYQASALAAVAPLAAGLEPNELLRGVEVLERRTVVATVAALAQTPATRTQAAAPSGYDIRAAVLPNTNLVRLDVQGDDPAQTAAIANRIPQLLSAQTRAMYKYYGVTMISPASAPTAPFGGGPGPAIAAGMLLGLLLGAIAAYATHRRAIRGSAA